MGDVLSVSSRFIVRVLGLLLTIGLGLCFMNATQFHSCGNAINMAFYGTALWILFGFPAWALLAIAVAAGTPFRTDLRRKKIWLIGNVILVAAILVALATHGPIYWESQNTVCTTDFTV